MNSSLTNVVLVGAAGKMGNRLTQNLRGDPRFRMRYVEASEAGRQRLSQSGLPTTDGPEAWPLADVVLLAVPDSKIAEITRELVPKLRSGALVIGLDPAAGYAGVLHPREDIAYFTAHPCHPPLFRQEQDSAEVADWFGGVSAPQSVVCALIQGAEADYELGEQIAAAMYAPILRMHRITVEQMAILEPGVVETTFLTLILAMREALDEAIRMGVPEQAAWDFALGHIRVELAIVFDRAGFPVSDGAKAAVELAKPLLLNPSWKDNALSLPSIRRQVNSITGAHIKQAAPQP